MQNKSELNKMKKAYFKVPNRIFEVGLSVQVIGFYSYLAKQSEEFNPAIRTICGQLGISKGSAVKYFQELKDRNIVRVIQPGGENLITKYAFVPTKDWVKKENK